MNLSQGASFEARVAVLDASSGRLLGQRELFLIYDTIPPSITNVRVLLLADHTVAVQGLAGDEHSALHEQRGLLLHYSVNGGSTWSTEVHRNRVGPFTEPTVFEFILGSFAPAT
jgi:hypothetical protein